jgi:hypothetical protein
VLVLLMGGIYGARRWDALMWHDIPTEFCEYWFRRSSNIKVVQKFVLVLLMGGIYGARRWDALM